MDARSSEQLREWDDGVCRGMCMLWRDEILVAGGRAPISLCEQIEASLNLLPWDGKG